MDTDMNMNVLCRTCMVQRRDLISIYDDEQTKREGIDCLDLLGTLTNTMPYEYDGLPKQVCVPCFKEIKRIHSFKLQCINSENMLKKLLSERKIDQIEIKPEEPSCSYADHMSQEPCQTSIPRTIESQGQVFEVIVKEEPDFYEPNLEVQLEDEHDGIEEEADCNETNQKCNAFDSATEPEGSEQSRKMLQCKNCNKGQQDGNTREAHDSYKIIKSQRGGEKLLADGYGYVVHRKTDVQTTWRCEKQSSLKCRGRAVTVSNEFVVTVVHNHHPSPILRELQLSTLLKRMKKSI